MNKWIYRIGALGLALTLMTSCDDKVSQIGASIQPTNDLVESEKFFLQFESETVQAPSVYTSAGTTALLGAYSDAEYGDFAADFVTQFRSAQGFQFSPTPEGGVIDSVRLDLVFPTSSGYIGSTSSPLQLSVYEVPQSFAGSTSSVSSLRQYADDSKLLGREVVTIKDNQRTLGTSGANNYISIKLNNSLGQRILQASVNNPEHFNTQESFNRNILAGLYVTASTGRGTVLRITAPMLRIYTHHTADGKTVTDSTTFINTKLTAHQNGISSTSIGNLLAANTDYTYSKGPAGVQTSVKLKASEMQRLLAGKQKVEIGANWKLADTQLKLTVDNPSTVLLNPPTYMLLLPVDSIQPFFEKEQTELTQAATSYLSTAFSSTATYYNFFNISRVITEHLKNHATYTAGSGWTVNRDLDLRLVPVARSVSQSNGSGSGDGQTTAIEEYMYPSFVRLKRDREAFKIGVVSSIFR